MRRWTVRGLSAVARGIRESFGVALLAVWLVSGAAAAEPDGTITAEAETERKAAAAFGSAEGPTQPSAEATQSATKAEPERGPVTNLPLPRFVSMKASKGNVRRGPSLSHRIDWVYTRREMPLEITAEYGNWRRVRDRDGTGGWMHYALLSGVRTVIVEEQMLPLRRTPEPASPPTALAEAGVVARLGTCTESWCRITAGGYRGWAAKSGLWGVAPNEIRD